MSFVFVFLVLTTVGDVFLRMICTVGHNGRDLLTNDERQKKGNNDKEVRAHITCNMEGKGFQN